MSGRPTVVFTFHSISGGPGPLCVSPGCLDAQLEWIARAGYDVVPLAAVVEEIERGRPSGTGRVALTFDDAYRDFATEALPILERRGLPATLFVTASADRREIPGGTGAPLLDLAELRGLAERGVEIGAHSVDHRDLTALDDDALERELGEGRRVLEDHAGRPVRHLAYPFGCSDARVRAAAARHYRSACTTRLATVGAGADPLAIPRVDAYYLRSPLLRRLLAAGRPGVYLGARRWLRRLRGTERSRGGRSPRVRADRPAAPRRGPGAGGRTGAP